MKSALVQNEQWDELQKLSSARAALEQHGLPGKSPVDFRRTNRIQAMAEKMLAMMQGQDILLKFLERVEANFAAVGPPDAAVGLKLPPLPPVSRQGFVRKARPMRARSM